MHNLSNLPDWKKGIMKSSKIDMIQESFLMQWLIKKKVSIHRWKMQRQHKSSKQQKIWENDRIDATPVILPDSNRLQRWLNQKGYPTSLLHSSSLQKKISKNCTNEGRKQKKYILKQNSSDLILEKITVSSKRLISPRNINFTDKIIVGVDGLSQKRNKATQIFHYKKFSWQISLFLFFQKSIYRERDVFLTNVNYEIQDQS